MVESADVTREELYMPLASMDERADVATLAASATTAAASEEAAVDHGEYVSMIRYVGFLTLIRLCMMCVAFCRVIIKIPSTSRALKDHLQIFISNIPKRRTNPIVMFPAR